MGSRPEESVSYPDFEEFIASLNGRRARYLVVGAYAVAFHARPRATKDLDVLVDPTPANAQRVRAALVDFLGSEAPGITTQKLTNPRTLVVLGVAPVRIDILTSIDGIASFGAAWRGRSEGHFGAAPAHYLSLPDLIAAKEASGRPQDLVDVTVLRKAAMRRPRER
jgi:hypothetical protein